METSFILHLCNDNSPEGFVALRDTNMLEGKRGGEGKKKGYVQSVNSKEQRKK